MQQNLIRLLGLIRLALLCAGITLAQANTKAEASTPNSATDSRIDPLLCTNDAIASVIEDLNISAQSYVYTDCRKDPTHSDNAIVALAYSTQKDKSHSNSDLLFALDIAIVDGASGNILASRHTVDDFEWTGGFIDLKIDTARYSLAPGLRAFGIRIKQREGGDVFTTQLVLYIQRGAKLQKLLTTQVGEYDSDYCRDVICAADGSNHFPAERYATVLCMGKQQSHGMTDIWTSRKQVNADDREAEVDTTHLPCGPTAPDHALWQYDGEKYVITKHQP